MRDDDVDTASVASCMTEDTDEPPAFSPEGLIDWMFEGCNRRFEDALISGNDARAQAHGQRRALLVDFMNFIGAANDSEREQATEMLNTIDDLSSHESSPSKDMEETQEARTVRVRIGCAAMVTLQSAMAMQLQGCSPFSTSSTSADGSWFSFAFLMTWTMLLAGYSLYMLYNMDQRYSVQAPHTPDMLNLNVEPQVTNESTSVEGLVTWTLVRARRRLRKMQAAGNIGGCMRYSQIQRWLETCLCHLPTSGFYDRNRIVQSLAEENTLSDDDEPPTAGMGDEEKHLMINSYGDIHRCLVKLLELEKLEVTTDLLKVFAEAFRTPGPPDDSDEPMSETQSQRFTSIQKQ